MEEHDRAHIRRNMPDLIDRIDLTELTPHLLAENLFSESMVDEFLLPTMTSVEKKRSMLIAATKRGPDAKQKLVRSLIGADQLDAARILQPDLVDRLLSTRRQSDHLASQRHPSELLPVDTVEVREATIPYNGRTGNIYRMLSNPRGLALLLVNETFESDENAPRMGADRDVSLMTRLLGQLRYDVVLEAGKTADEVCRIVVDFARNEMHARVDSCVVVISSHGDQNQIVCSDNQLVPLKFILEAFDNDNCPLLTGKPKMFFIQACRGEYADFGVSMELRDYKDSKSLPAMPGCSLPTGLYALIPTCTDMYITYATLPGRAALRNARGSWLFDAMVRVFTKNAYKDHLADLMAEVSKHIISLISFDNEKQVPEIINRGFVNHLYFNPGL